MYYTLLMLDRQLQISESTCDILKRNLETVEAMKEAAMANSAAVEQSRTAYAQVLASLPDIRQSIRETENALCLMLNQPAQSIARGTLEQQQLPAEFSTGIPLQLLSNRPDVKAAEMSLAASYYDTNSARAAFYPQITLSRFCRMDQQCRFRYYQSRKAAGIRYRFAHTTSVLPRCQHCPVETSKGTGRASQNPVPDHTAQGRK